MPYGEAVRLTRLLSEDPSSRIAASVYRWKAPVSPEWLLIADLYDLTHLVNTDPRKQSQVKPYPRPYGNPNDRRRGRTDKSRAEVVAILNAHGHNIEAEVISHG